MPISYEVAHAIASIDVPIDYRPSDVSIDVPSPRQSCAVPTSKGIRLASIGYHSKDGEEG
jgi:hypothetical protein